MRTLTQIESVKKVVYEYTDIANENSIVREELTNDSFSDMDNFMNPHEEYNIYMPDSTGQKLVQKTIDLDRSAPESLEEQMVAGLMEQLHRSMRKLWLRVSLWMMLTECVR